MIYRLFQFGLYIWACFTLLLLTASCMVYWPHHKHMSLEVDNEKVAAPVHPRMQFESVVYEGDKGK